MKYILLFIFMPFAVQAFACSCKGFDSISEEEITRYTTIFKGEVLSIKEGASQHVILFKIEKLYKGAWKQDTISIRTRSDEASCGLIVTVGQVWLLYAKGGVEQEFWTSTCFRSLTTDKEDDHYDPEQMKLEIEFLEKRKR